MENYEINSEDMHMTEADRSNYYWAFWNAEIETEDI